MENLKLKIMYFHCGIDEEMAAHRRWSGVFACVAISPPPPRIPPTIKPSSACFPNSNYFANTNTTTSMTTKPGPSTILIFLVCVPSTFLF